MAVSVVIMPPHAHPYASEDVSLIPSLYESHSKLLQPKAGNTVKQFQEAPSGRRKLNSVKMPRMLIFSSTSVQSPASLDGRLFKALMYNAAASQASSARTASTPRER